MTTTNETNVRTQLFLLMSHITDPILKTFTMVALQEAPDHFWHKPSSAGNHHPADEHGEGGLALHTLRVARVCWTLCQSRPDLNPDVLLSAGILHDIGRYGLGSEPSKYSLKEHPDIAAAYLREYGDGLIEEVACAVETHSGRWGRIPPRNELEWMVHYADCISANYQEWSSRII
jgi:putative nucleotidyltransferase with HDIG domain